MMLGIADSAGNLFAVGVEGGELTEELDQGAFTEGVGDGCVEGECRIIFRQVSNPRGLKMLVR